MAGYTPVPYAPGASLTSLPSVLDQVQRTQAASAPAPTQSGGDVAGASTYSAPVDQYAQWGGKQNYDAQRAGFQAQTSGVINSANDAASNSANQYKGGILDFLDQLKTGQRAIDNKGVQAELSKRQGAQGVLDYVNQGIQSGGVMLNNKNSSTSSAVEALARAYSTLGGKQMAGVGTQYAQDENAIQQSQDDLNQQVVTQGRHNDENKTNVVNSIVADAAGKLSALDAAIAGASLPDRINIEQQKNAIRDNAMRQLQQYDATFSSGVAGIKPSDSITRQSQAANLANAGTAADNPYQLTAEAPATFQGGAPAGSSLPIFTLNKKLQQAV